MSAPVVWILAFASAVLLIAGGFVMAVARFRGRVAARRRQAARLGAHLEGKPSDPFGELQVIGAQLRKIQQRLGQAEEVAGLPVRSSAPAATAAAPQAGAPVTMELEQDLDLFKKEVYSKTHRIDELMTEKQLLADKIVQLETALATAPAPSKPSRRPKPTESNMALVDVLQQEADELRNQIAQQDQLLKSLEKSDTSGLVKEVGRIRQELLGRNEEVKALEARLVDSAQSQQLQVRLGALETERDGLAAQALETAGQLRRAKERIADMERSLAPARAVGGTGGAQEPPQPPATTSRPPPPPAPSPHQRAAPPPTPPSGAITGQRRPTRPQSRGFPDEPTVKTAPPEMTPAPRQNKRRPTGSIFPPPQSKKDLLD